MSAWVRAPFSPSPQRVRSTSNAGHIAASQRTAAQAKTVKLGTSKFFRPPPTADIGERDCMSQLATSGLMQRSNQHNLFDTSSAQGEQGGYFERGLEMVSFISCFSSQSLLRLRQHRRRGATNR